MSACMWMRTLCYIGKREAVERAIREREVKGSHYSRDLTIKESAWDLPEPAILVQEINADGLIAWAKAALNGPRKQLAEHILSELEGEE